MFGIQDKKDNIIQVRDWMSANKEMILDETCFCVFINRDLLQKSRHFGGYSTWVVSNTPQ